MRNYAPVKICLYNTIICFKLNREIISLSLKGKTSHQKEKHVPCHNCNYAPIDSKIEKSKATI